MKGQPGRARTVFTWQTFRRVALVLLVFGIIFATLHAYQRGPQYIASLQRIHPIYPIDQRLPREAAGNATLGFQAILALSLQTPWRIGGLQAAAAYTGLHITVPEQKAPNEHDIEAFEAQGGKEAIHPGLGSARAWVAHLNLIQYVIDQGFTTALIMEDDVDWDVRIRSQMKPLSDAMRSLDTLGTANETSLHGSTPYGLDWDLLWIGNCGENVVPSVEDGDMRSWPDGSVVTVDKYVGFSHNALEHLPYGHRAVVRGMGPICTFAYAVTRAGAEKIYEQAITGNSEAFDTRLSQMCHKRTINCRAVAPELMHEYVPPKSDDFQASDLQAANGKGNAGDFAVGEAGMGSTKNILASARCKAIFDSLCFDGPKP